ncbi:MAG: protein BatD [Bacteroidetes bacterium]|nr:protein BatD [Bacteroidota bacterium]MBV6461971.1 hypothetical protein [Flavobacteriales bacterium]WKZ76635.1 MAG: BatD family protein [Vicingaceae bacterium]MCL4815544.1 BatD family protein [Flavobacteriales bacterium]NOG94317.1 protein BatD [Bacteroidota bacterium]
MVRKIIYTFLFLPLFFQAKAQNHSFTAKTSHTQVATSQQFKVEYTLNANGSQFTPPDFKDFRVLSGPNQSSSMSWINGSMSASISYSYYLLAVKEGEFTIPPAKIKVSNEVLESNSLKITVIKGQPVPQQYQQNQQQETTKKTEGENISDYIFLQISTDKNSAHVGEPIVASYKIYTRVNIVDNDLKKMPDLNGFWSYELKDINDQTAWQTEVVNGQRYNVAELKRSLLFPQRSGNIELDVMEMDITIQQRSNKRSNSLFDQFFGSYENIKYNIKSNKKTIKILPLPEANKPPLFNGAVGIFLLDVNISKTKVKQDEAIDVKIKINGSGNIKLLENIKPDFPEEFEVYDPEMKDNVSAKNNTLTGSREYHYIVIPREAGNYTIPPVSFSYFDLNTKKYNTHVSDAFQIEVEKSDEKNNVVSFNAANKKDITILDNDIRFIEQNILLENKNPFLSSPLYFALVISPFILLLLVFLAYRKNAERNKNTWDVKSRNAAKLAKKYLSTATLHLQKNETQLFYEALSKGIFNYFSDKLKIPFSHLTLDLISEKLSEKNMGSTLLTATSELINDCEMARFAPLSSVNNSALLEKAKKTIYELEEKLNKV